MSTVRKHFWQLVSRLRGGVSSPTKYGFKGCMPAVVSRTEVSVAGGTSDPERWRRWPWDSKKPRKVSRISSERMVRLSVVSDCAAARPDQAGIESRLRGDVRADRG